LKTRQQKTPATRAGRFKFDLIRANAVFFAAGACMMFAARHVWDVYSAKHAARRKVPVAEAAPLPAWGRLEVTPMLLEKPAPLIPSTDQILPTRWSFAGWKSGPLGDFLATCGADPGQRAALISATTLTEDATGCVIRPLPETVLALAAETRARIYRELEKHADNIVQQHPFRIRTPDADLWFTRVGLPPEKAALAMRLTYQRGGATCFSDLNVARHFLTPGELTALVRALYSSDTFLLSLRIRPGDPVEKIADYWGHHGRETTLLALLKSVESIPGGGEIDVAQLLPALPRSWVNTYPALIPAMNQNADCYWTALNFFRARAEDSFITESARNAEFRRAYTVVPKATRLGDIIIFVNDKEVTQHACVHVADDIVFTKNGARPNLPWVFMRLDEVRALYENGRPLSVLVFRLNST
jgi:hypothetical protein